MLSASRTRRRRGFTLIEGVVAVTILAFAVAAFAATVPGASKAVARGRSTDLATNAAVRQLEFWRNVGYASTPLVTTGAASQAFAAPTELPSATGTTQFAWIDSSWAAASPGSGFIRVTVTVTWSGGADNVGTVQVTGILAQ